MGDTSGDPQGQHELGRLSLKRPIRKTGEEDGSSSADDFGLRRRFVSSHHLPDRPKDLDRDVAQRRLGPTTSAETVEGAVDDSAERQHGGTGPGSESRRILDPEDPVRDLPLMMKKKKKKKSIYRQSTDKHRPEAEPRGKSKKFRLKNKPGALVTGDDMREPREDSYVIYVMRDFIIYLIFLIITSLFIFGMNGSADNYFANILEDLVVDSKFNSSVHPGIEVTFNDINHRGDMWTFIDKIVLELVYERSKYSQGGEDSREGYQIMLDNVLFGVPQLRQVRVKGKTCKSAPLFDGIYDDCADYYSAEIEDTSAFGSRNSSAWVYKPATREHVPVTGVFSTYGGGGFSINLGRSLEFSRAWLRELQEDGWVRFGTRAVILDFNLFNINTQLFCAGKLVFEMPPIGGIVSNAFFTTVRLVWYSGTWSFFLMSCQLTFVGFILYYTYEETSQMIHLKELYLDNWWNMLDITIILVAYVNIALYIGLLIMSHNFLNNHLYALHTNEHVSLDRMVAMQLRVQVAEAILAFIVWVKIMKFSTLNRTVSLVLSSFALVRSALITATIMMAILMFAFALLGMCIAGSLYQQISSFGSAVFTLFGLLGGGIRFYFARKTYDQVFRTWLLLYIIVCIVIYINIFVALIVHGFELALNDTDYLSNRATLGDVIREVFCKFLLCIRKPQVAENIYLREEEKQNIRVYIHLAEIVARHGFNNREIGLIFTKHKIIYGQNIPVETMSRIYEEINVRNQLFVETEGHNQVNEQLDKITRNIEQVDQTVMSVMTKVDTLTNQYLTENIKK